MRILIAEDDEMLGDGLYKGLTQLHYLIDWFTDGMAASQALRSEKYDLIILDLGLPKIEGMQILRDIREEGNKTPVLILTARESIEDCVKGLDGGADDYLTKPFDFDVLLARIRALHRRNTNRSENRISHGDILLEPQSHTLTYKEKPVNLPRREFTLLHKLLENVGHVLSREQLNQSLYGWHDEIDSNALEVHIHNLRKKFGNDFIRTVRGVGYIIEKIDG